MALRARQTITQRIALEGGEDIRKELLALGRVGEQAFKRLQAEAEKLKGPGAAFEQSIRNLQRTLRDVGKNFTALGTQFQATGRQLSAFITAPIVAGFGLAIKAAVDFESAMADVRKVVDFPTPKGFGILRDDLIALSRTIPLATTELAGIAAAAGQAGVAADDLTEFTKIVAEASVAFGLTSDEAGRTLARLKNALSLTVDEVSVLTDAINQLGNNVAVSEAEVLNIIGRVAALGDIAGVSARDVAAVGAAMVSMQVESTRAATTLRNLFIRLTAGAKAPKPVQEALEELGLTSVAVAKSMNEDGIGTILDVFDRIIAQAPEVRLSLINALFGERAVEAIAPLLRNLDETRAILGLVANEADFVGSRLREAGLRFETTGSQIQLLKNSFTELGIAIGDAGLLDSFTRLVEKTTEFIQNLAGLRAETLNFGTVVAGLVGTLGPLLFGIGILLTLIGQAAKGFALLGGALLFLRNVGVLRLLRGFSLLGIALTGALALFNKLNEGSKEAARESERHADAVNSLAEAFKAAAAGGEAENKVLQDQIDLQVKNAGVALKEAERKLLGQLESIKLQVESLRASGLDALADEKIAQLVKPYEAILRNFEELIDFVQDGAAEAKKLPEGINEANEALVEAKDNAEGLVRVLSGAGDTLRSQTFGGAGGVDPIFGAGTGEQILKAVGDIENIGSKVKEAADSADELKENIDGVTESTNAAREATRSLADHHRSLADLPGGEEIGNKAVEGLAKVDEAVAQTAINIETGFGSAFAHGEELIFESINRINAALGNLNAAPLSDALDEGAGKVDEFGSKAAGVFVEFENNAAIAADRFENTFSSAIVSVTDQLNGLISALDRAISRASQVNLGGGGGGGGLGDNFASGGLIGGFGTSRSDSNLIRASRGEFVLSAEAVRHWGVGFVRALNMRRFPSLDLPSFATGGLVGDPVSGGGSGGGTPVFLNIGGETVRATAEPSEAERLIRLATTKQVSRIGRNPVWNR